MRDSLGGTMLFWIVLFLFSIFIIFIAFIIKYARVYKIKNTMVSYVEKNEGIDTQANFDMKLLLSGYPVEGQYKICRVMLKSGGYYTIELYSRTEFPVIGNFVSLNIAIKGETKTIKTGTKIKNTSDGALLFNSTENECFLCTINKGCDVVSY
jgi:hypothetical protein